MRDWLTNNWEASWRSFHYFNLYRLLLAALMVLGLLYPSEWTTRLNLLPGPHSLALVGFYATVTAAGFALSWRWFEHFNLQLSLQVLADVLVFSGLMYVAGGVGSGLGLILLISLAAASLVGQGRLVLFYAAMATMGALISQIFGIVFGELDSSSIVQAGFISAAYFATAILARLLGQRVMLNEDLARRRGIALDNQILISQRVVERMQDGVLIVSRQGEIMRCNPMAERLLGLSGAGGRLLDRAPELALAFERWLFGKTRDDVDFRGAGQIELNARFEPTTSSDGEILIFVEDMERIKDRARQLKLAALGRLTASIAHEIRNPLSAISHAGELLKEERRGEIHERLLRIIGDNTARLNRIVGDVLELGRQKQAQKEVVDLTEFFANFRVDFLAGEQMADGVLDISVPEGCTLCFDRAHLHQIVWNLLGNALRHSSRGAGAVRVIASVKAALGSVELHIQDDGPGIPESEREQIFEPFFTTHHLGTGLGLFIARELCVANSATLILGAAGEGGHFILSGRNTCLATEANDDPEVS